jgi:hypothetical protein
LDSSFNSSVKLGGVKLRKNHKTNKYFSFFNSWNDMSDFPAGDAPFGGPPPSQQQQHQQFGGNGTPLESGSISLQELQRQATAVVAFGNVYPVLAGSNLFMAVMAGEGAVKDVLRSEFLL